MGLVTTYNSTTQGRLCFLDTYPTNGNSLNLDATNGGGAVGSNYTGIYWRPASTCTSSGLGSAQVELGFNVRWGSLVNGKVSATVELYLSESACWFNISNNVKNSYQEGYYYTFSINGTSYNLTNAGINEWTSGTYPNFSQSVNNITKNYTFRYGSSSSTRTYIKNRATRLWSTVVYITPVNGVATLNITNVNLWFNFYWNSSTWKNLSCTNINKTFTSNQTYYTNSISLSPNTMSVNLVPKTANIQPKKNNAIVNERTYNISDNDVIISDSMLSTVTEFKDTVSTHRINVVNNSSGTALGSTAWNSSNTNVIKINPTNSTYTDATYNGTGATPATTCNITCTTNQSASAKCSISIVNNKSVTYSSNNPNIATINATTGAITALSGRNGTYTINGTYNGGLISSLVFNSLLVPNTLSIGAYSINNTNQPISSLNYGEQALIRAGVGPYNASNNEVSVASNYRPITFDITGFNGSLGTTTANTTDVPYYETIYTAPTGFGPNQTVNITATPTNLPSGIILSNAVSLTINENQVTSLPNLVISVQSVEPNPVNNNNYALVTYTVDAAPGETLTQAQRDYIDNVSLIYSNTSRTEQGLYPEPHTITINADVVTSGHNFVITNNKRQCVYKVTCINFNSYDYGQSSLQSGIKWKLQADLSITLQGSPTPITAHYVNETDYTVKPNYVIVTPEVVVMNQTSTAQVLVDFNLMYNYLSNELTIDSPDLITYSKQENIDYNSTSGSIIFTINSLNQFGTATFNLHIIDYNGNHNIVIFEVHIIDNMPAHTIFSPYVYSKDSALYFNNISYQNKDKLRLVFQLPNAYTFQLFEDIQVKVTRQYNNIINDSVYSLLNNKSLFSISYPTTASTGSSLKDEIDNVTLSYQNTYNESPYCIFCEPYNVTTNGTIISFELNYMLKSEYSRITIPNSKFKILTDNTYNVELPNFGDSMIGYDSQNPNNYPLKNFIEAYKSISKGYLDYLGQSVDDVGRNICSLTHFGAKGTYISLEPFFKLLVGQKYINALENKFIMAYLKTACIYMGLSGASITMPEVLYCDKDINRLMYVTQEQIAKYGLNNIVIKAPTLLGQTNVTILNVSNYLPTNTTKVFSILANSNVISPAITYPEIAHNNTINDFVSNGYNSNYTIYPLEQFANCLPSQGIRGNVSNVTFNVDLS